MTDAGGMERLPHRAPFRFVDRVLERNGERSLVAVKTASAALPAGLVLECLAQAAGLLAARGPGGVLAAVNRFRLRRVVEAGDVLEIRVERVRSLGRLLTARGEIRVAGERVASGEVVLALE